MRWMLTKRARQTITLIGVLLCWAALGIGDRNQAHGAETVTAEFIVEQVRANTGNLPATMTFGQDVRLKLALFSWHFRTEVERDETGVRIRTINAPSLLPDDITGNLLDVSEALDQFSVRLVSTEIGPTGDPLYVLEGERLPHRRSGAESGTIWVDGEHWHVRRVEARYPWGQLEVEQQYGEVEGHTVLLYQDAYVMPWRAEMKITYRDYSFGH